VERLQVQLPRAPLRDLQRAVEGLRLVVEHLRHLVRCLEAVLSVDLPVGMVLVHRLQSSDAHQNVLRLGQSAVGIVDIVASDQREVQPLGETLQLVAQAPCRRRQQVVLRLDVEPALIEDLPVVVGRPQRGAPQSGGQ